MSDTTTNTRRVYVADLHAYNSGTLHGVWLDVTDADTMHEEARKMIAASPVPGGEEYLIHDYDGDWFRMCNTLGETADFAKVCEVSELLEEHGEAYAAYVGMVGGDYATPEGFQDAYLGNFKSAEEYAEQFADDTGMLEGMPENLRPYFDFEAFARDMQYGGDISVVESRKDYTVFVFNNNA